MNIKEAKNYIKDSVRIYLKKDEEGEYRIPVDRKSTRLNSSHQQ